MKQSFITAGVMGWPISHSRSPTIHNHWIRHYGLIGSYGIFPVEPMQLEAAIRGLVALGLAGCNITIPYKVDAMQYMDWLDPLAIRIGAINTIVVKKNGELHGFNNDAFGFIQSLLDAQPHWQANSGPAVVLGAGGAARAIVVGLIDAGVNEIRLLNRTLNKAKDLSREFGSRVISLPWDGRENALAEAALLVNTTSLGMQGQNPLEINLHQLPTNAIVFDAIYTPLETPLLANARQRGNLTVNGLGMLLHQARPAFKSWFDVMPAVTPELKNAVLATFK